MFNKTYKDLNTFSNVQQLIVLKNYDMVQRLEFIWYDEALFYERLLFVFLNEISTYIPFFKEKNISVWLSQDQSRWQCGSAHD